MCCNYLPVVSRKMLQFETKLRWQSSPSLLHSCFSTIHRWWTWQDCHTEMLGPVDQRKPVSAAGTLHLPPVTHGTDNNRQVFILLQLSRDALQSAAYQSGDKEQRRKSWGRASPWFKVSHTTLVQWCFTPPLLSPCWWSPFPSANKSTLYPMSNHVESKWDFCNKE